MEEPKWLKSKIKNSNRIEYMQCVVADRLKRELDTRIREMEQSDTDMKNPHITLRIRSEGWRASLTKVHEVRASLDEHRATCSICKP